MENEQCLGTHDQVDLQCFQKTWFKYYFPLITGLACVISISFFLYYIFKNLFKKDYQNEEEKRKRDDREHNIYLKQEMQQQNQSQSNDQLNNLQQITSSHSQSRNQLNEQQRNSINIREDSNQLTQQLIHQ